MAKSKQFSKNFSNNSIVEAVGMFFFNLLVVFVKLQSVWFRTVAFRRENLKIRKIILLMVGNDLIHYV